MSRDDSAAILSALGNLPAITGETIDADAATSPTERTDAPTDAEPQTDAETRRRAFKAAYMALTDANRRRRETVKHSRFPVSQ